MMTCVLDLAGLSLRSRLAWRRKMKRSAWNRPSAPPPAFDPCTSTDTAWTVERTGGQALACPHSTNVCLL